MKISYLREAYFGDVTTKKTDNRSNVEKLQASAKKVMDREVLSKILPCFKDPEFLYKIGNCFKDYIHVNANSTPPAIIDLKFVNLENKTISFIMDAHYTGNATQRNHATAKSVLIEDTLIERKTIEEINADIDNFIGQKFYAFWKKRNPEVLKVIDKIHIEHINLWANAPESVHGEFPDTIKVKIRTDYYADKIVTEKEAIGLLNKISKLFSFCVKDALLELTSIEIVKLDDSDAKNSAKSLIDAQKWQHPQNSRGKFDHLTLTYISGLKLSKYTFNAFRKFIDLKKFFSTNPTSFDDCIKITRNASWKRVYILTTETEYGMKSVENELYTYFTNKDNNFYTICNTLPDPKSGFIEYLVLVTEYRDDWSRRDYIKEFVDGKLRTEYALEV